jgi:peptidoglycan biosynthesis protein MviN/MurJ (putative lipid II flippase)
LFVVLSVGLTPALGLAGLALANSVAFTTEAGLMLLILYRRRYL